MSEYLDQSFEKPVAKRPVFLTVICILTFVSCGLGLLSAAYGLFTAGNTEEAFRTIGTMQRAGNPVLEGFVDHMAEFQKWSVIANYLSIGNCLICGGGALLMWNLKKVGFFVYCLGQVLPFISLFGMYSILKDIPYMGFAMILSSIAAAIFAVGFVIMYAVNLKHMRN